MGCERGTCIRWMFLNRLVDKLIEELKAEQSDGEDLAHLTLPSIEEASFEPMKPRFLLCKDKKFRCCSSCRGSTKR